MIPLDAGNYTAISLSSTFKKLVEDVLTEASLASTVYFDIELGFDSEIGQIGSIHQRFKFHCNGGTSQIVAKLPIDTGPGGIIFHEQMIEIVWCR